MESVSSKKIGLFGGSFDPIHIGHLIIAQDAVDQLGLSEVIFIPAAVPPHKQHLDRASAEDRLNMVEAAVDSNALFSVSDAELKRGGVSYTFDTVTTIAEKEQDAELVLIIGSDTLVDLHNWYKIDELAELCEFASFMRPGESDPKEIRRKIELAPDLKERVISNTFESRMIGISSSEIRRRTAEGAGIRYLVPEAVEQYILKHGLYRG